MSPKRAFTVQIDDQGRLVLPPEAAARLGLRPGARTRLTLDEAGLRVERPVSELRRVYLELTNLCNLDCTTCMRRVFDEPLGRMTEATFERVLAGLAETSPRPTVFIGGYGEPLFHPRTLEWLQRLKALGCPVELITNGTLLNAERAAGLVEAGLDVLWVSIDGATPETYEDVRLGAELQGVLENITRLRDLRDRAFRTAPEIGVAFVAMQRNAADLPNVILAGLQIGAIRFSVTNVLAHTPELRGQVLYEHALYSGGGQVPASRPHIDLPRLDFSGPAGEAVLEVLRQPYTTNLTQSLEERIGRCPFVEKGSLSVRWDGQVSPCLPLLHTHCSYLDERVRTITSHSFGSINERSLLEVWNDPEYLALRERLQFFDFSPCVYCNACDMADHNREDCFGNVSPTCGGCLWAQGLIQCP